MNCSVVFLKLCFLRSRCYTFKRSPVTEINDELSCIFGIELQAIQTLNRKKKQELLVSPASLSIARYTHAKHEKNLKSPSSNICKHFF